jgi:hypothetical protein
VTEDVPTGTSQCAIAPLPFQLFSVGTAALAVESKAESASTDIIVNAKKATRLLDLLFIFESLLFSDRYLN